MVVVYRNGHCWMVAAKLVVYQNVNIHRGQRMGSGRARLETVL